MKNSTITQSIQRLTTALLLALALVAAVSVYSALGLSNVFTTYQASSEASAAAMSAQENVLAARLHALKNRIKPESERIDLVDASINKVLDINTKTEQAGVTSTADFSGAAADMRSYSGYFTELNGFNNQMQNDFQTLEALTKSLGQDLSQLMDGAFKSGDSSAQHIAHALEKSLLADITAHRYLEDHNPATMAEANTYFNEARNHLSQVENTLLNNRHRSEATTAKNKIGEIRTLFEALHKTLAAYDERAEGLDRLGANALTKVQDEQSKLYVSQLQLAESGQSTIQIATFILITASLLTLIGGVILTRMMQRRIAQDLQTAVDDINQLASGDNNMEINGLELQNEIGELARAMEKFRQNAIEAERLRTEAAEAEEHKARAQAEHDKNLAEAEEKRRAEAAATRQAMLDELQSSVGTVVTAASHGDYSVRIEAHFEEPALETLAAGINSLLDGVEAGLNETSRIMERISAGQLDDEMKGDFEGAFAELQASANAMTKTLTTLIGGISNSGATLKDSSSELMQSSDQLAQQAEQNAASVEQTSTAIEELTASIKMVSENVDAANNNAREASTQAENGVSIAENAGTSMEKISHASEDISKATAVINDIAFQINLLALNAGVEAARAGEAGRGFSVVASEVRQLAQRADEAAKEISEVILLSNAAVTEGVENVASAKSSLVDIAAKVVNVSQSVAEITVAMNEQATGVDDISRAMSLVDANTQKQAAAFEEVNAASHVLAGEAAEMQKAISVFKTGISTQEKVAPPEETPQPTPRNHVEAPKQAVGDYLVDWEEF